MKFNQITPEKAGVKSEYVREYISFLEKLHIPMHSLAIMKGEDIFCECYWAPYTKDSNHRMYSQTKSYVSVAIGFLIDEGKLSLDDKIVDYFEDKIHTELDEYLKNQTIRDMLMMCTTSGFPDWFDSDFQDRADLYFNSKRWCYHPSGTLWEYDSAGSQVLTILVERLSGKTLFDYLNDKLFKHLGTFKNAEILKARGGDSWGDSALLCTIRDMLSFARFVMNYGVWNGKRLLSEKYLKDATSCLVNNLLEQRPNAFHHGYGYQIWRTEQNGFAFVGMGNQLTVCLPDKDLIFTCTADCQGDGELGREAIINGFFGHIVDKISENELCESKEENQKLTELCQGLELFAMKGNKTAGMLDKINGKVYTCEKNRMGITQIKLDFEAEDRGTFYYTNEQGEKALTFGINRNEFSHFPQLGYSNDMGGVRTTDGFMYKCATSGAWLDDSRFFIYVQIIDRYLGNARMVFNFKDDCVLLQMEKTAEDFLEEYYGQALGWIK